MKLPFLQTLSMPGVVKVYCVHSRPDFSLPWQRNRQVSSHSTGFMIDGGEDKRWLLTNAHSVEYHSQVTSQRYFHVSDQFAPPILFWEEQKIMGA